MATRLQIIESALDDFVTYDIALRRYMAAAAPFATALASRDPPADATAAVVLALEAWTPALHLAAIARLKLMQLGYDVRAFDDYCREAGEYHLFARRLRPKVKAQTIAEFHLARTCLTQNANRLTALFDKWVIMEGGARNAYQTKIDARSSFG